MLKICNICNSEFVTVQSKALYCSDKCRTIKERKRKQEKDYREQYTYICCGCGIEYHPKAKNRNKYCSRECNFSNNKNTGGKINETKRLLKQTNKLIKILSKLHDCEQCGKRFIGNRKVCSDECLKIYNSNNKFDERKCKWCDNIFKPYYKTKHYEWCCIEHKNLYITKQKRLFKKNNPNTQLHKGGVSKAKRSRVWERDNFICKLCNEPLRMDMINTLGTGIPHPLSPTVDHIVPKSICKERGISKLQMNNENNLQSAHFICNTIKGNRI